MPLCRLVYYSEYNSDSRRGVADDLKQILATAVRTNSEKGITGGLIFNRHFFGQVLEGDRAAVTQTFVRINGDARHNNIVLAGMESVSKRLFGTWSMGYAATSLMFEEICADYGPAGNAGPPTISGPALTAFILGQVSLAPASIREEETVTSGNSK